jgi:hypothetical protein
MATYTLIDSEVLTASAASVTFSAIPATYTDLVLRMSIRKDSTTFDSIGLRFNGSFSGYSFTALLGDGSSASSLRFGPASQGRAYSQAGSSATSNTFGSIELYVANYAVSASKVASAFGASENNATSAQIGTVANLWQDNAAITSIEIINGNFVSGSSFYLYGISNA